MLPLTWITSDFVEWSYTQNWLTSPQIHCVQCLARDWLLAAVLSCAIGEAVLVLRKVSLDILWNFQWDSSPTANTGRGWLFVNTSVVLHFPLRKIDIFDVFHAFSSGNRNLEELFIVTLFPPLIPFFRIYPVFLLAIDHSRFDDVFQLWYFLMHQRLVSLVQKYNFSVRLVHWVDRLGNSMSDPQRVLLFVQRYQVGQWSLFTSQLTMSIVKLLVLRHVEAIKLFLRMHLIN